MSTKASSMERSSVTVAGRDAIASRRMSTRRAIGLLEGSARCYGNVFGRAPESHLSVRQRGCRRTSRDGHTATPRAAAPQPRLSCPRSYEPSLYGDRCGVGRCGYAAKLPGCKRDVKTPPPGIPAGAVRERQQGVGVWRRDSGDCERPCAPGPVPLVMRVAQLLRVVSPCWPHAASSREDTDEVYLTKKSPGCSVRAPVACLCVGERLLLVIPWPGIPLRGPARNGQAVIGVLTAAAPAEPRCPSTGHTPSISRAFHKLRVAPTAPVARGSY